MDDKSAGFGSLTSAPLVSSVGNEVSPRREADEHNNHLSKPDRTSVAAQEPEQSEGDASTRPWATIEDLYIRHAENLRGYLRRLVGSGPPDPDDVVQAAFEKIATVGNLDRVKSPHAFLWRTAQNIVTSAYRHKSVRDRHEESVSDVFYSEKSDTLDPERVLLARKELSEVIRAVELMPPARRSVLLMSRVEGLSITEISERLGISRSAVHKRLSVAMTELHAAANRE